VQLAFEYGQTEVIHFSLSVREEHCETPRVLLVLVLIGFLHELIDVVREMLTHGQFHLLFSCKLFQTLKVDFRVHGEVVLLEHVFLFELRGRGNETVFAHLPGQSLTGGLQAVTVILIVMLVSHVVRVPINPCLDIGVSAEETTAGRTVDPLVVTAVVAGQGLLHTSLECRLHLGLHLVRHGLCLLDYFIFVVPALEDDRGVVVESNNILLHLLSHQTQESISHWLHRTREHEFLPDQQANSVELKLEFTGQLVAPSPNAHDVHVCSDTLINELLELFESDSFL